MHTGTFRDGLPVPEYLRVMHGWLKSKAARGQREGEGADLIELSGLGQGRTLNRTLADFNQNRMWSPLGLPGDHQEEELSSAMTVTNRIC